MRTICVWQVLFKYAHEAGQSRLVYNDWPTKENRLKMEEAVKKHDEYRDLCLESDEMIGIDFGEILRGI